MKGPGGDRRWTRMVAELRSLPAVPLAIVVGMVGSAVLAPWLGLPPPEVGKLSEKLLPPGWMAGGTPAHPLGTDLLGRDLLSRVIFGARVSLSVGFLAVSIGGVVGTAVGIVAGYYGGRLDAVLMRVTDMTLSLPLVLMAIVLVAILGASYQNVVVVVMLLLWPYYARQIRAEALGLREAEFVDLARIAGCSGRWIMWRHVLPNVMPTFLVLATLQVGQVILLEASLSFLGVGIPPPTPAWGLMVSEGREVLGSAWWVALWPGLATFLVVFATNLLGDWIRDRLDPKLVQPA